MAKINYIFQTISLHKSSNIAMNNKNFLEFKHKQLNIKTVAYI